MKDELLNCEWLETDGLGGFSSCSVSLVARRRYHALFTAATVPPAERLTLLNNLEVFVETPSGRYALSGNHYYPDVYHPDGSKRLIAFEQKLWPKWCFKLNASEQIDFELLRPHLTPFLLLRWLYRGKAERVKLLVRPLLSARDINGLQQENGYFNFSSQAQKPWISWQAYQGVPSLNALANAAYRAEPIWFRNLRYTEEEARGFPGREDLASPGVFSFELNTKQPAVLIFSYGAIAQDLRKADPQQLFKKLSAAEAKRRAAFKTPLSKAADCYLVQRGKGKSIIAGYPWFGDWGRDTFIALRGLCLPTKRFEEAGLIFQSWMGLLSKGMLPNCFHEFGKDALYNSVDAALWFVIAADAFEKALPASLRSKYSGLRRNLNDAIQEILQHHLAGTRYGIGADSDGLLKCGCAGMQLTWMDVKIGDQVITARTGKPVEIQALWINALAIGSKIDKRWQATFFLAQESFAKRFWNEHLKCLYDVVDADHETGKVDATVRPNQILAVGGLPLVLLNKARAKEVVTFVERHLWTALGLRSLANFEPGYHGRYLGGPLERDTAYHLGTAWAWLLGPFIEAWLRINGSGRAAKRKAYKIFFKPVLEHLNTAGLGHVSEIADGEPPHHPRGAPFQAWSVGEALRVETLLK